MFNQAKHENVCTLVVVEWLIILLEKLTLEGLTLANVFRWFS